MDKVKKDLDLNNINCNKESIAQKIYKTDWNLKEGNGGGVESRLELKKELGVVYGVAVIMGLIIGGGIYISPQVVLRHAASPGLTIVMWLLGGIFSFLGALCFAEIGVKIPRSGAHYAYLTEFYGPYFGFMFLWEFMLLIRPGSNALKATLIANFLAKLFFPTCPIPTIAIKCIASFFTVGICFVNCLSVKLVAKSQTLMSMFSFGTLLTISIVGFLYTASGSNENLQQPFSNSSTDPGDLILAFYNTIFSYSGWAALNTIVEEVKNPSRTLPLSIAITMTLMTCLYTLVNLSYLAVLGRTEMIESEAVAISVALKVWPPLAWVFSICIAISSCSSFNSAVLVGSRVAFAGARNGHVPKVVSYINVYRFTPTISIVLNAVLVLCYIWFAKIDFIIQNLTFCFLIMELMIVAAFVKIRWRENEANQKGIFKLPLALIIFYVLMLGFLCVVPLVTKPLETTLVFAFILFSTSLLYAIFVKWKPPFLTNNSYLDCIYQWIQIIFSSAPPDKEL